MVGKNKQAQRTKNNSRPSNSGRSAELLGASLPNFVGFTAIENCGFVPVVPGLSLSDSLNEEIDASVDSSYQLVLRKMSKKDPTTKAKGLQEFSELVNSSEVDSVKAILPFWPRLYSNLSMDVDHKVRESAQTAMVSVVGKVGKFIAPFLRQLAPSWIISQYDSYAPAGSMAALSFQKSFPPHKLKEVFSFCQNEIVDFISNNIIVHTANTFCNPKIYNPEESEAKYQRVLTCSLKGYALYLRQISAKDLAECKAKNQLIIDSPKFWNYSKNKTPSVRAAWFEVIASLLEHTDDLLANHKQQTVSTVLQAIEENEPIVLAHVWASILLVQSKIDEWATLLNLEKGFYPRLWKILKSSGNGNAAITYLHLLPMISHFTQAVLAKNTLKFYGQFFDSIKAGLQMRNVQVLRGEMTAIAAAYYECIRYIVTQMVQNKSIDLPEDEVKTFCTFIIDDHIIAVIYWLMNTDYANGKYVYPQIASLLNHWNQNSVDHPIYESLIDYCWQELHTTVRTSVESDTLAGKITESQLDLVQSLRNIANTKVKAKVKFARDETDDLIAGGATSSTHKSATSIEKHLVNLTAKMANIYLQKISETRLPIYVTRLESLFNIMDSDQFFVEVGGVGKVLDKCIVWLEHESLVLESSVDIAFDLNKYSVGDEKMKTLRKLVNHKSMAVRKWAIQRLLSHPWCLDPEIPGILAEPVVVEQLVQTARHVIDGQNSTDNLNLLHKCFFQTDAEHIIIGYETAEKITDVISLTLTEKSNEDMLDTCASFLAQVMPVICTENDRTDLKHKMFLRFFKFSVNESISDSLSEDTLWEITTSWQDALSSNDLALDDKLLGDCANIVHNKLANQALCVSAYDDLAEKTAKLMLCASEHITDETERISRVDKMIDEILNRNSKTYKVNTQTVQQLCLFIENTKGTLTVNGSDIVNEQHYQESSTSTLEEYFKMAMFKINVISKLTSTVKKEKENVVKQSDDDDECTDDYFDADENLLQVLSDEMYDQLIEVFYANGLAEVLLHSDYLNNEQTQFMLDLIVKLELYIKNCREEVREMLKSKLFQLATERGLIWAKCLPILCETEEFKNADGALRLLSQVADVKSTQIINPMSSTNIIQSLSAKLPVRHLPIDRKIIFEDECVDRVALQTIVQLKYTLANYFAADYNRLEDSALVKRSLSVLSKIAEQKSNLLYSKDFDKESKDAVIYVTEIAHLTGEILRIFPNELTLAHWDFVRIAVSSWVLTIAKNVKHADNFTTLNFMSAIYKLFGDLSKFIVREKLKSSTEQMSKVIDEWNYLFAKDVHLVLVKCFMQIIDTAGPKRNTQAALDIICCSIDAIDCKYILLGNKLSSEITLDNLFDFLLAHLSNPLHSVRIACTTLIKCLSVSLVAVDEQSLLKRNEHADQHKTDQTPETWHCLAKFSATIEGHNEKFTEHIESFKVKTNELADAATINANISLPYLLLIDTILHTCSVAPSELRSVYARWISENKYEQVILPVLFRLMPADIIKNCEAKNPPSQSMFTLLDWSSMRRADISTERYACHIYAQILRFLPALVRKWWNDLNPRQKILVDKVTTNYVSALLCQEELRALVDKKEKHDNMQITVHSSTREVVATYSIDEARMELITSLPLNHPLGAVKIESGRQIGGRLQSRVLIMQLTIFLTHQNGTIWDGLSLWKRNLDKKFEGVEECYVCYSVIHQDTCQLPKLSCKTCKKKFHGPCLYKWFSTSNKSTCPICRNIF